MDDELGDPLLAGLDKYSIGEAELVSAVSYDRQKYYFCCLDSLNMPLCIVCVCARLGEYAPGRRFRAAEYVTPWAYVGRRCRTVAALWCKQIGGETCKFCHLGPSLSFPDDLPILKS